MIKLGLISEDSSTVIESDARIVTEYDRTIQLITDSPFRPTELQIKIAIGISIGSPYPNDWAATCESITIGPGPERTRPPNLCYHVKYHWSTKAVFPNTFDTDPTLTRTRWSLKPSIQTRYVVKDRNENMILNSAGSPFDGGIPVDVRLGTAVAKKYTYAAGYNQNTALANSGKLNSNVFLGGDPKTVQVDIEATEHFEGAYRFWEETYTFAYDPLGWQPKPMNAGFFQKTGGKVSRIRNQDVDPTTDVDPDGLVQEPEPLLTTGAIVPLASRPASCNFIEVDAYPQMDFAIFNL